MHQQQLEQTTDQITFALMHSVLSCIHPVFQGFKGLKDQVRKFVENDQPVTMLLPAFPCKSVNRDKVLGALPDMGEYLAIKKFVQVIRDVEAFYPPGMKLVIFSDYHTFSDYISVDMDAHYKYSEHLSEIVNIFNASSIVSIRNFQHFPEFSGYQAHDYIDALRDMYGDQDYNSQFDQLVTIDDDTHHTYLGLKKFMAQDQKYIISDMSKRERNRRTSEIAKGMMLQGKALDRFLTKHFADHIRLSIHGHPLNGLKYSVYLFDESQFKTPWHNTVMFDAISDDFVVDPIIEHKLHQDSDTEVILTAQLQTTGADWMMFKLSSDNSDVVAAMKKLKITLLRPQCGLILDAEDCELSPHDIDNEQLTALNKHFGIVVLRNFKRFNAPTELESWYATRGNMIPWKFGYTHIVAPVKGHQGKPASSVDSEEGLPIHWDLLCPPGYMGITQDKYEYKDFIPREFMLYCHRSEAHDPLKQGVSVLVDSLNTPLTIHGQLREKLRNTSLSYSTKLTYFGGESKTFPLIMKCPWTKQDVMRWWEVWSEEEHPGTIQPNYSTIADSAEYEDMKALEAQLRTICLAEQNHFTLQFMPGDAVLVNNHTMLHGRTEFTGYRELWRIQMQPPTLNSPFKPFVFENEQLYKKENEALIAVE